MPSGTPAPVGGGRSNGLAATALAIGIIALLTSVLGIGAVVGLVAVGFGIAGLVVARTTGRGGGLAVAGITTGALGVVAALVVLALGLSVAGTSAVPQERLAEGHCTSDVRSAVGTLDLDGIEVSEIEVCRDGIDDFGFTATFDSTSDTDVEARVRFEVLGSDREVLGSGEASVSVAAGERARVEIVSSDAYKGGWAELEVTRLDEQVAEPSRDGHEATAVMVEGEPLPMMADGGPDDLHLPAPTLEGFDFDEDATPTRFGGTGTPQLIVFMAHWCPYCQATLPRLVRAMASPAFPHEVEVVVVSTFQEPRRPNYPPSSWLEREGFAGTVIADRDLTAADAFGVDTTPSWVVIDASGIVALRGSGEIGEEHIVELAHLAVARGASNPV